MESGFDTAIDLILPTGRGTRFGRGTDGLYRNEDNPEWAGATIFRNSAGRWELLEKSGGRLRFDENGHLVEQLERGGSVVFLNHDSYGKLVLISDGKGREIRLQWMGDKITEASDMMGRKVQYRYTSEGRLLERVDPIGGITRYTYDTAGRMETITDARGIEYLRNEYDTKNRVIRQSGPDGEIVRMRYVELNATRNAPVVEAVAEYPGGKDVQLRFDSVGWLLEQVTGGLIERYKRDEKKRLIAKIDPLGRETQYKYDSLGNVIATIDPIGNVTKFEYEKVFNKVTKITDPLGNSSRMVYSAKGDLTGVVNPLGHATTLSYKDKSQPISITDALGNITRFLYDAVGNLITTIDPTGNKTQRTYDAAGRLIRLIDPKGRSGVFAYDDLNRVTQIEDAQGGATRFTYDQNGNLLTVTDAKNQTTRYSYDVMDRLESRADSLGRSEFYAYDVRGNLIKFTDRKGQMTTFEYDLFNRRTKAIYQDGANTSYTYDAVGNVVGIMDSQSGEMVFSYDLLDRLVREVTPRGVVVYAYDAAGKRTTMGVNGQTPVEYRYDAASRLTQVAEGNQNVGLGYDAMGRRTTMSYPNGVTTDYAYDAASRLTGIAHQGTVLIESLVYTYDANGNRVSIDKIAPQADLPKEVQAAYDAANEMIQFNTDALTYDANGNLINDGTKTYQWDARNRLIAISGPSLSADFGYDAMGRRISKTINGTTTEYLYDGNDIVAEIEGNVVTATYLRGLNIDEPFVRASSTGQEFYHTDALGSVLALTDQAGAVQTSYRYDPFGNTTITGTSTNPFQYTGRENDGTGLYYYRARYYSPTMQRFISEDPLNFTSLQLLNQQVQERIPEVAQLLLYLQSHPDLSNLYLYVVNNPLMFNDPHGLIGWDTAIKFLVKQFGKKIGKNLGGGGIMSGEEEQKKLEKEKEYEKLREDRPPCMTVGGRKPHAC